MKFTGVNFSLADRINSAKSETSNKNDISAAPDNVTAKPGDSNIKANTSQLDTAGENTAKQSDRANNATSTERQDNTASKADKLQYEKQNDPEFPKDGNPETTTPKPKKKGFAERLLEKGMANMMEDKSGRPNNESTQTDYPKDQTRDINKPQPEDNTPRRPNTPGFDPSNIGTIDPQPPQGDLLDAPWNAPGVNLGPSYKAPGMPIVPTGSKVPRPSMGKLPRLR